MGYKSDESKELYRVLEKRGYSPEFCELISSELRTTWTANRMLGYLRQLPRLKEEDIVDEMLGILADRDRIRQKKEMEYYQGKINEIYMYGLDGEDGPTSVFVAGIVGGDEDMTYEQITMDEAKDIFQSDIGDPYIIVDVRREDEFAEGHIPGAINIPNESIEDVEPTELPDKDQLIFVYCRSGNRSKQAAEKLFAMGYTQIIEFGGIIDWTGEIEK